MSHDSTSGAIALIFGFLLILCHGIYDILDGTDRIPQEYANANYTILTTNYTGTSANQPIAGLLFRNYCLSDYGTELASYHSQADDDLYFDLVTAWQNHPWGLRFFECTIGLTNRSYVHSWEYYDGTPYDFGILGSNTSKWSSHNTKENRCVRVDNSLGSNARDWSSFICTDVLYVHCVACNTPKQRPYLLELGGTWDDTSNNEFTLLWVQLNGTDLFGNGINSIEFFSINITDSAWSSSIAFDNYENIGPIETITFLAQNSATNITINQVRINYFKDRAGSSPIHLETEGSGCNYVTITVQYWYQNYTIDDGTGYGDACIYGQNFLPTLEPTNRPSLTPSSIPTNMPSVDPSRAPSGLPSSTPTGIPSQSPTGVPSDIPSTNPTRIPTVPSYMPTTQPTGLPTDPSSSPTKSPSSMPSTEPSADPTNRPSMTPTNRPTDMPIISPTDEPTQNPTKNSGNNNNNNGESNTVVLLLMAFGLFVLIVICGTIVICWYLRNTREQLKAVKQQHGLSYDDGAGVVNDPNNPKYINTIKQNSNSMPATHAVEMHQHPQQQHHGSGSHHSIQVPINQPSNSIPNNAPGLRSHPSGDAHNQPGGPAKEGRHTETREGQALSDLVHTNTSFMWQEGEGRRVTRQGPNIDELNLDEDISPRTSVDNGNVAPAAGGFKATAQGALNYIDKIIEEDDDAAAAPAADAAPVAIAAFGQAEAQPIQDQYNNRGAQVPSQSAVANVDIPDNNNNNNYNYNNNNNNNNNGNYNNDGNKNNINVNNSQNEDKRSSDVDVEELREAHGLSSSDQNSNLAKSDAKFKLELNDKLVGNDILMDDIMADMEDEAAGVDVDGNEHVGVLTPGGGNAVQISDENASLIPNFSPISEMNNDDIKNDYN